MSTIPSHHPYFTTVDMVKSILNKFGFTSRKQRAAQHKAEYLASLRAKRDKLDKQALELVGDNDAYYANRMASWRLTEIIIKEVR